MRSLARAGVVAIALAVPSAAGAQQGGQFQGFGGLTFGDVASSTTFGGSLAVPLSDHLQVIGEGGRMTDVMPSLLGTLVDFTPVDVRVSAWYGEGGLRFIASPGRAVRPYVETTAGFARLSTGFAGAGGRTDAALNTALNFLDRTEPMLGAGGGVLLQGGPLLLDLGYRYKKIFAGDSWQSVLTGGDIGVSQVRIGAGIRF